MEWKFQFNMKLELNVCFAEVYSTRIYIFNVTKLCRFVDLTEDDVSIPDVWMDVENEEKENEDELMPNESFMQAAAHLAFFATFITDTSETNFIHELASELETQLDAEESEDEYLNDNNVHIVSQE